MSSYFSYLAAVVIQLTLLAKATDLLGGHCGRLGFGAILSAAFGGYIYALAAVQFALNPWLAVVISLCCAGSISMGIAILLVKLNADGYLLATFAFQMAFVELVNNLQFAGGPLGIRNVPPLDIPFMQLNSTAGALVMLIPSLILGALLVLAAVSKGSALRRRYHWIRDDPLSAKVAGIRLEYSLMQACFVHSFISALSGIGIVIAQGYVAPKSFDLWLSLKVLSVVIVSGTGGNPLLMIFGSAILVGITEIINTNMVAPEVVGPLQQIFINLLLVSLLVFRRRGLAGPELETGPSAAQSE